MKIKDDEIVKIDLGGGLNPQKGFITMDPRNLKGVDFVHGYENYPWPFGDHTATLIKASFVVEKINPANNGFIKFMNECWRILKTGGQLMISTPYAGSQSYWSDPTNINGCTAHTWEWFDPLHPANHYKDYKPLPWEITKGPFFQSDGLLEVLLVKRMIDPSYKK
jgi:predicted SAM-dependent methyltransferase